MTDIAVKREPVEAVVPDRVVKREEVEPAISSQKVHTPKHSKKLCKNVRSSSIKKKSSGKRSLAEASVRANARENSAYVLEALEIRAERKSREFRHEIDATLDAYGPGYKYGPVICPVSAKLMAAWTNYKKKMHVHSKQRETSLYREPQVKLKMIEEAMACSLLVDELEDENEWEVSKARKGNSMALRLDRAGSAPKGPWEDW